MGVDGMNSADIFEEYFDNEKPKYIIRNCPEIYENYEDKFVCTAQIKQKGFPFYCATCTDCVMKRIVKRCRKEQEYHKEWQKETGFNYAVTGLRLANDILKLLDIEEVE
jgi:hypothetical protein